MGRTRVGDNNDKRQRRWQQFTFLKPQKKTLGWFFALRPSSLPLPPYYGSPCSWLINTFLFWDNTRHTFLFRRVELWPTRPHDVDSHQTGLSWQPWFSLCPQRKSESLKKTKKWNPQGIIRMRILPPQHASAVPVRQPGRGATGNVWTRLCLPGVQHLCRDPWTSPSIHFFGDGESLVLGERDKNPRRCNASLLSLRESSSTILLFSTRIFQ